MHLGQKLKLYRREHGLDQFEMAEKVGVSHRKYQEIEKTGIIQKVGDLATVNKILNENAQKDAQEARKEVPPKTDLDQVLPMGDLKLTVRDYINKVEEMVRKTEEHNLFLQKMLSDKTEVIDQNLKKTLAYAGRISLRVDAASEVALESLARLEKKPEGSLVAEVGKEVAKALKEPKTQGS